MTADLPWINTWISKLLSDGSDNTPLGYLLYYSNMSIFSMFLLPLVIFLVALGLNYLFFNESGSKQFRL
jgi:hypothetical protein